MTTDSRKKLRGREYGNKTGATGKVGQMIFLCKCVHYPDISTIDAKYKCSVSVMLYLYSSSFDIITVVMILISVMIALGLHTKLGFS